MKENTAIEKVLKAVGEILDNEHIDLGDLVYSVREREGKGWDGPSVTSWSEAVIALKESYALASLEAKEKPTAPAELVEDVEQLLRAWDYTSGISMESAIKHLRSTLSRYRPASQTDLVGAIISKAKSRHMSGGTTQAEGWVTENEIEEIIRKHTGGTK